jgi:hypothetical protein
VIPVGEFLPDQPAFGNPGTDVAYNVLPATRQSYGPFPALAAYSSTGLGARCQGALAAQDSSGDTSIFAGDATDLYRLAAGSTAWENVSKSAAAYTVPSDGIWDQCQFGQQILFTDFNDAIQAYTLNSSTDFANLGGTPPKAKYIAVVKNFVAIGFTNDGTFGIQPQRVWWSGINNSASWLTPGTSAALAVQSDYQDIVGDHGWLQGIVPNLGFADAALFFERAVYRMQYVGAPYFFTFAPAEKFHGTPAPSSLVQIGGVVYYLGPNGFRAFDGATSIPIGAEKVDNFFYFDASYGIDNNYMDRVSGAVDPVRKIVYWAYAAQGNTNGIPNRVIAYHTTLNRWSFIPDQETEILFNGLTVGYTLSDLSPGLYATLADIPFPLDSRIWTGGQFVLGGFNTSHKYMIQGASNLAPTIDTMESQLYGNRRAFVNSTRPLVDGGSPSIAVGYRNRIEDALTYSSAVAMNANGECPQRNEARYQRFRLTLPSASSFNQIQGVEVWARPAGMR